MGRGTHLGVWRRKGNAGAGAVRDVPVCGGAVRVVTVLERRLEENVTRNILMALLWGGTMCACSDRVTWGAAGG